MSNDPLQNTNIVVFDGVCVLCNRWVQFIIKHDHRKAVQFAAMQSVTGQELLRKYGLDPRDPLSLLLVDANGGHIDTNAIIRVLTQFRGLWRMAALLRLIPTPLRDASYRYIARNRYRWFGIRDTCITPSNDHVERFLP